MATTPDKSEAMHRSIAGSELVRVPDSGHTSPLEQPEIVTEAIRAFLRHVDG